MIKHRDSKKEIKIRTFLIYDADSGQIIHRHRQVADSKASLEKERLLKLVRPEHHLRKLEILEVAEDALQLGKKYRVNGGSSALEEVS